MCAYASRSGMSDSLGPHGLQPTRLLCPWDSPDKDTGVDCHSLLQGSSQLRDWTRVSCISGGFFTIWVTREAHISMVKKGLYINQIHEKFWVKEKRKGRKRLTLMYGLTAGWIFSYSRISVNRKEQLSHIIFTDTLLLKQSRVICSTLPPSTPYPQPAFCLWRKL